MTVRFPITVELALGADISADPATWSWTDITNYVYVREGGITITRGRADEQTQAQPSSCTLLLNNRDGRFTRLNPTGAYYGTLTKNTPLRVKADPGGGAVTRFVGFVSEWPVRWDPSENDGWVNIRADGVLRRLGQGSASKSAAFRTFTSANTAIPPVAYWPLNDPRGSLVASTPITGASDGTVTQAKRCTFGEAGPGGSGSALLVTGDPIVSPYSDNRAALTLSIPSHTPGEMVLSHWIQGSPFTETAGADGSGDSLVNAESWLNFSSGTLGSLRWWASETVPGVSARQSYISAKLTTGRNGSGTPLTEINSYPAGPQIFDGQWHHIAIYVSQSGADVAISLYVDGTLYDSATEVGYTLGLPSNIRLATSGSVSNFVGASDTGSTVYRAAQLTIHNDTAVSVTDLYNAGSGYDGEQADDRVIRLCGEESLAYSVTTAANSVRMGPQAVGALPALLRDCEAADSGALIERKTGELGFDGHTGRENQTAALTLNYASKYIAAGGIAPNDDDQLVRNDWTVTRSNGGTRRVTDDTGPLGTSPLTGVGRYDDQATLNVYTDDLAYHAAGWRVNLGTANGYRFPQIMLQLHNSNLSALRDTIAAVDISNRTTIQNLPSYMPPDDVDLIVEGYTETINSFEWTIVFNCAPYKPWNVLTLADTTADQDAGRLAGDEKCAIRAAINSSDLSMAVDPNFYRWTTAADDFDPDLRLRLGGEVVAVSGISTTAATYVAAGAGSSATNAAVTPAIYAGAQANDLICVLAAIGTAGTTGTLSITTGYTRLPVFGSTDNVQLFAKVHDGSESDPTVTPSGGGASDVCSAITFGLRGTPCTLADLTDIVLDSATFGLNSSAQNIAYPGVYPDHEGCIVLALGWKRNAWNTGGAAVATLSGFTEAFELRSGLGNEQGLVGDYQIQTTPTVVNEGSFVVTGGLAAVSRGAVAVIAGGYQTFTISARSVNGVTKSHTAATTIEVEDPLVLSL